MPPPGSINRHRRAPGVRCACSSAASSASSRMGGTQRVVKRLASAGDSSRLPWSPPGFMVATRRKPEQAIPVLSDELTYV